MKNLWYKVISIAVLIAVVVCSLVLGNYYPFQREFLAAYLAAEAAHLCLYLIGGQYISKNSSKDPSKFDVKMPGGFLIGRISGKSEKDKNNQTWRYLWAARIFSGFVELVILIARPDFFQANILMSAGMIAVFFTILLHFFRVIKRGKNAGKKKRNGMKIIIFTAAVVIYLLAGVLITGFQQPGISDEFIKSFQTESFYGNGEFTDRAVIIEDNNEALIERVRLIKSAKEQILFSTFDFRSDLSGKVVLAALLDAAERGVKVQIVVDGVSGRLRMGQNPYFFALSSHKNAEIRIYSRINLLAPWKLMGRMHDKYIIADNRAYILGGRNSFSYFLGEWPGHKNYDRDVLVYNAGGKKESSIYQVEAYFYEIWNLDCMSVFHNSSRTAKRASVERAANELRQIYKEYLTEYPAAAIEADYHAITYPTKKITLLANPTTPYAKEPTVFYALAGLMEQAKKSVTIHTPYIISNDIMYDTFAEIAEKVPEVIMMTNSVANNGNPFGAGDYRANIGKILNTGMSLYEYEGGVSYHGKSIVIDDNLSVVGSFNMDMRSAYLDTELMLVIDSEQVNAQLRECLSRYEKECGIVQPDGTRIYPEGVTPQKVTREKNINMALLYGLLRWARRLL